MYTDLDFKAFKKHIKNMGIENYPDDFYLRLLDLVDFSLRQWAPLLAQVMEYD